MNNSIAKARLGLPRTQALLLVALFGDEAIIFYVHVVQFVTPFYPPRFDQLSYYLATYDLVGAFHAKGFGAFVDELLQPGSATGSTFVLQGALLSLIGGENRTAFLSINLIYLLALQFVFFVVVRARTGRLDSAWVAVALLLSSSTLFNAAGGIYDYRIDFSALCLYGIWICLIVWSGAFRHSGKALIAAVAAILLIYSRFFTIIYIAGTLGALLAINLYGIWKNTSDDAKLLSIRRVRNILVSGAIIAALCLPRLYLSRDAIYGYYMIGHVLGEEKYIRAHELGLHDLADHLLYYPKSILENHVGLLAFLLAGGLALWSWSRERLTMRDGMLRLHQFGQEFAAIGVAVLVPVAALTANISKSPVVGGVLTVPILLAMVLFGAALWPRGATLRLTHRWSTGLASVAMTLALAIFIGRGLSTKDLQARADLERITLLAKSIATYAKDNGLDQISMSTDRVVDYQNVGTPRLFSIEEFHRNLNVTGLLGHGAYGIFATPRDEALRLVAESDVIVLTDAGTDRMHPYPINSKIGEYWDELWQWTRQNRTLLLTTEVSGIPYRVFVRPVAMPNTGAKSSGN